MQFDSGIKRLRLTTLAAIFVMGGAVLASQQPQPQSKGQQKAIRSKASVSGRAFLVTRGGDLKVARAAKVYLLWSGSLSSVDDSSQTSAIHYMRTYIEGLKELTETLQDASGDSFSEASECLKLLQLRVTSIADTIDWSLKEKKNWQMLVVDADEETGSFKFDAVRPGFYILIAEGQAGLNQAYWGEEPIKLLPGQAAEVKLSSPKQACMVPEE